MVNSSFHTHQRRSVLVELWEISHDDRAITFSTSPQRGAGRVVALPHADIRRLERDRRPGDYFTRTFVTLAAAEAERHHLSEYRMQFVFIDELRAFPPAGYRDAHTRRVGAKNGHQWAHMWCAVGDEDALHRIARQIGLRREWFQPKEGFPHYDVTPSKRVAAIRAGAQPTSLRTWLAERAHAARSHLPENGNTDSAIS